MSQFIPDQPLKLADETAERVRRAHAAQIAELQKTPAVGMVVLPGVSLADGVATPIAHKLGRKPTWVMPSVPRGTTAAGYIVEVRDGTQDLGKVIVLKASGFGATITVDVAVM